MTRIKICGITRSEDVDAAVAAGADALGFIFVPESPRYLADPADAFRLINDVPPFVERVVVCKSILDVHPLVLGAASAVQVYDVDSPRPDAGCRLLRVLRVANELDVELLLDMCTDADALALDTYDPVRLGGSGRPFDWELAAAVQDRFGLPVVLAGGLTAENVGEAIQAVRPFAVDVSSSVECAPGQKDPAKIARFVEAVRLADAIVRVQNS